MLDHGGCNAYCRDDVHGFLALTAAGTPRQTVATIQVSLSRACPSLEVLNVRAAPEADLAAARRRIQTEVDIDGTITMPTPTSLARGTVAWLVIVREREASHVTPLPK